MSTLSQRPRQNPRFNLVTVENEAILYDNETHNVIYLDTPASMIWLLCNGERDLSEIVRVLVDAYPDGRERIALDVTQTVAELTNRGALTATADISNLQETSATNAPCGDHFGDRLTGCRVRLILQGHACGDVAIIKVGGIGSRADRQQSCREANTGAWDYESEE